MGLFSQRSAKEPSEQDDRSWLSAGHRRFERDKNRFFGSPETMRRGGEEALNRGDFGAAVFFFAKAIDIAQTWSSSRPNQRSYQDNVTLFRFYVETIKEIKASHPDADVLSDWCNENGVYAANMMVSIAKDTFSREGRADELDKAINDFLAVTGMPVPDHW